MLVAVLRKPKAPPMLTKSRSSTERPVPETLVSPSAIPTAGILTELESAVIKVLPAIGAPVVFCRTMTVPAAEAKLPPLSMKSPLA